VDIIKPLLKLALFGSQWVMWLLLGLSVLSISAMVERWFFFRSAERDVDELGDKLSDLVERGDQEGAQKFLDDRKTIEAAVLARAIRWVGGGPESLADAIDGAMTKKRKELERGMNLLGTLGNNAPFVGLLGTVIGVIQAFNQLGAGQDKSAMPNVMASIGEALVATGVGLFVAIPAVVAFNVFQKRVAEVEDNVSAVGKQLGAILRAAHHVEHAHAVRPARAEDERASARAVAEAELAS
jgi:biopolymer transport protein ExbB/TolQ